MEGQCQTCHTERRHQQPDPLFTCHSAVPTFTVESQDAVYSRSSNQHI